MVITYQPYQKLVGPKLIWIIQCILENEGGMLKLNEIFIE